MSGRSEERPRTPDDGMSKDEKEDLIDQTEEFEGPDRREIREDTPKDPKQPGVANS